MGCQGRDYRGKSNREGGIGEEEGNTNIIGIGNPFGGGGRAGRNAKKAGWLKKAFKFMTKPKLLLRVLSSAGGVARVAGVLSMAMPFLGPAAVPMAIAAGAALVAFAAYKAGETIYDWVAENEDEKEKELETKNKVEMQKALNQKTVSTRILDNVANGLHLEKKTDAELQHLFSNSGNIPMRAAVARELKRREDKKSRGEIVNATIISAIVSTSANSSAYGPRVGSSPVGPYATTQTSTPPYADAVDGGGSGGPAATGPAATPAALGPLSGNSASHSASGMEVYHKGIGNVIPSTWIQAKNGRFNPYTGLTGTQAYRNNNPGNISGAYGLKFGAKHIAYSSGKGLEKADKYQLIFDSLEDGYRASHKLAGSPSYNRRGKGKYGIINNFRKWQSSKKGWDEMVSKGRAAGINLHKNFNELSTSQQVDWINIRADVEGFKGAKYKGGSVGGGQASNATSQPSADGYINNSENQFKLASDNTHSVNKLLRGGNLGGSTGGGFIEKLTAQLLASAESQTEIAKTHTHLLASISGGVTKDKTTFITITGKSSTEDNSELKNLLGAHAVNPVA